MKFLRNGIKAVLLVFFLMSVGCASKKIGVSPEQVESELKSDGATGWIHAAIQSQGLYVFTYRNPHNFFDYLEMSLTTQDPLIEKKFAELSRHDKVKVKGLFLKMPVPQKHIDVTSIELVKKYDSGYASDPYQHQVKIPDDLLKQSNATFMVHAVAGEGHILVVEYRDTVFPVFIKNAELAKNLYRGDIVSLNYRIQKKPHEPVHLRLNEDQKDAVKVLDPILALHGKPAWVEGRLILFPKSPEISLNVFAVEATMPADLMRQYTLANLDDPKVFNDIVKKCQDAWNRHGTKYVNGRNKLVSQEIRVKAKGIFNEVDPNQANAQILIKTADDIQILE